jgi:small subunit ribosomal protein S3
MGQKTNPVGLRLGIIKGWESNWYGGKNYASKLIEDEKIRNYLNHRIPKGGIARIVIERTLKRMIITIQTARPGTVIGKGGQEVEKLRLELKKLTSMEVQINIYEIKRPELDARLIGENIAQQLAARISFRRAMKSAIQLAMRNGALGVKVMLSGRLGGAEIARSEMYKEGRVPLQTLRADIDYASIAAQTIYGKIGVKVWVFKGELYGKVDLSPEALAKGTNQAKNTRAKFDDGPRPDRRDDRRGGDRRDGGRGGDRRGGGGNNNQNNSGGGRGGRR